ncbi:SH2 domain-containing adapter protein D [Bombina bombina]|uniref:SH2 domain-containing adapter protein D n=1 Tax=Bombina bombina TaxID=8345 RepID=UPI00235AB6AC|nr:SH2 domain-containing adapter protein D [Bombina bombina]
MAKWLKDYLSFGSRRSPPQPPKPDYTESEILRAYRAQKSLDFEDPYEERDPEMVRPGSPGRLGAHQMNIISPRHRLIKVEPAENGRSRRTRLGAAAAEDEDASGKITASSEYSDPFDVKNEKHFNSDEPDNTSYMEPYEIQKTSKACVHWVGEKLSQKGVQLYDSPYEERCRRSPRDSRQPPEDERPADEYDQPWEWKKDDINRAFAVQFEGSDWRRNSPQRERLIQHNPRSPGPLRQPSHSPNTESVDSSGEYGTPLKECATPPGGHWVPNLPVHKQEWFHGTMNCTDAEIRLYDSEPGGFLLRRECESEYYLSLRGCNSILHVKITRSQDGGFMLGESGPSFPCVPELVQYYSQHLLPIPGGGQLSLQQPVPAVMR